MTDEPEDYHVYTDGEGEPEHKMSPDCFCNPILHYADIVTGIAVYVHKERSELMQ